MFDTIFKRWKIVYSYYSVQYLQMVKMSIKNPVMDRYFLGIVLCLVLCVSMIIGVWVYYDKSIKELDERVRTMPSTTLNK